MIPEETSPTRTFTYDEIPYDGVAVPFRFDDPEWLKVEFVDGAGVVVRELARDAGTTGVQPDGSFRVVYDPAAGGDGTTPKVVVRPALPEGLDLRISRAVPLTQPLEMVANAPLRARALEGALDRLTMALQDQKAGNGSVFRNVLEFPPTEPPGFRTQLPDAGSRAGMLLGFDGKTGEMRVYDPPTLAHNLEEDKMTELRARANAYVLAKTIGMQNQFMATRHEYMFRGVNKGLKLGEVGNHTDVEREENHPGEESITIQPGYEELSQRAKGERSVAIGYAAHAEKAYGVSIGTFARANETEAVALGHSALATGEGAVAVGLDARAEQGGSVALGQSASTPAQGLPYEGGCVAVGNGAVARGGKSVAVGVESLAAGDAPVALGRRAMACGDHHVAIGHEAGSSTVATRALSLGASTKATAEEACAVGVGCDANARGAAAVGVNATANGPRSTAVGCDVTVHAADAGAYGYELGVTVDAVRSTAIGHGISLKIPDCVDIRTSSTGRRLFIPATTGGVCLSYATRDTKLPDTANDWGNEPATAVLPRRMLAFRVNAAKTQLFIDVSVETTPGTFVVKTATLAIS